MSLTDKVLSDYAGVELTIPDAKVPISVLGRSLTRRMRSVAWLTVSEGPAVQMTTHSAWGGVQAQGTTETLHQWHVRLCALHPRRLTLRVDVPLDVGDEDEIRGYHELDQDGRSKALVKGHTARCCVANKVERNIDQRVHIEISLENTVIDRTTRHCVGAWRPPEERVPFWHGGQWENTTDFTVTTVRRFPNTEGFLTSMGITRYINREALRRPFHDQSVKFKDAKNNVHSRAPLHQHPSYLPKVHSPHLRWFSDYPLCRFLRFGRGEGLGLCDMNDAPFSLTSQWTFFGLGGPEF